MELSYSRRCPAPSWVQLIAPSQSLQPTRLIFAVRGGGQLVEEDVGVAAANLTGGHRANPAWDTQHTLHLTPWILDAFSVIGGGWQRSYRKVSLQRFHPVWYQNIWLLVTPAIKIHFFGSDCSFSTHVYRWNSHLRPRSLRLNWATWHRGPAVVPNVRFHTFVEPKSFTLSLWDSILSHQPCWLRLLLLLLLIVVTTKWRTSLLFLQLAPSVSTTSLPYFHPQSWCNSDWTCLCIYSGVPAQHILTAGVGQGGLCGPMWRYLVSL